VADCLAGEPEFGVVLIDRGHEVGGGDVRRQVATVARIVEVAQFDDGRSALVTVGTRRIRVEQWLDDDPYPRAEVSEWPDDDASGDPRAHTPALEDVLARLRRVLALQAELGEPTPPFDTAVSDDPIVASYHACALAPLGPDDQYRLLSAAGAGERRRLLEELLIGAEEVLRYRLSP